MDAATGTGGSIADSLEEFDKRYSESYNQILSSPILFNQCSEEIPDEQQQQQQSMNASVFITYQDFNTRLELSSPLMEDTPTFSTPKVNMNIAEDKYEPEVKMEFEPPQGETQREQKSATYIDNNNNNHHQVDLFRRNKSFSFSSRCMTSSRESNGNNTTINQNYTSTSPVTIAKLKRQLSITIPAKPSQYVGNPFYKRQLHKLTSCLPTMDLIFAGTKLSRSNSKITKSRKNSVRADDGICLLGRQSQMNSNPDTSSDNDSETLNL